MTSPRALESSKGVSVRNDSLLRALQRQAVDRTPVWFMRQAGRSLPEYRAIKEHHSLLEICRQPQLCAEVTVQPVRRLGVDAAVLYADIILPLIGVGLDIRLVENVGPVVDHPVRSRADVERMRPLEPEVDVGFVLADIRATLELLNGEVPLIGFAGAPFTLASYLIEGAPSRHFLKTKSLMYSDEALWQELMSRLTAITVAYLRAQIDAGVHAVQVFDSWAGNLSVSDYRRYVLPHSQRVFAEIAQPGIPLVHFVANGGGLLEAMAEVKPDALSVDWRVPLDVAWNRIGTGSAIQGNLDPATLLGPWDVVQREAEEILRNAQGRPGHVFNTGHGIHPSTDPDQIARLVSFVHEWR